MEVGLVPDVTDNGLQRVHLKCSVSEIDETTLRREQKMNPTGIHRSSETMKMCWNEWRMLFIYPNYPNNLIIKP